MSFRELSMVDVREVLRRWQSEQSARQIARDGVVDRKTAARYVQAAMECGVGRDTELTDEVVGRVVERVQARPEVDRSDGWKALEKRREQLTAWLRSEQPLRLVRVQELLARDGLSVPYTTLRRFAHEELGWRERRVTVRVDDSPPGEEAQIDFAHMGYVVDVDGVRRKLWVLIVTLTLSRYMHVWPTFVQTVEAVCDGLDAAWRFFEGVPKRVVPDNMSAIVARASATQPILQKAFAEYAQSRGFFVDPARVRKPQDKARVENQVAYVRERWFAGESFRGDLDMLREHAERWCREIAGTRIHGTTRQVPRDVYEAIEKPQMLTAPTAPFDVPVWSHAKVHPDHHVQVARALYSVPTRFVGEQVEVRADRSTVRIYCGGALIKVHGRVAAGKRATDASDYPAERAGYALRNVDGLIAVATKKSEHIGEFARRLLDGPNPWGRMRQAYGLLRLCDRYGIDRVDTLCARALSFGVIDVGRIEGMLKKARLVEEEISQQGRLISLPPGRFVRDPASFATRKTTPSEGGAS